MIVPQTDALSVSVHVLDEAGVDHIIADRDAAWLMAVAAQVDEDFEAARIRHERAFAALYEAVSRLALAAS